jgi:hypothetical protein
LTCPTSWWTIRLRDRQTRRRGIRRAGTWPAARRGFLWAGLAGAGWLLTEACDGVALIDATSAAVMGLGSASCNEWLAN